MGCLQKQKELNSGQLKVALCSELRKGKTCSTSSLSRPYLRDKNTHCSLEAQNNSWVWATLHYSRCFVSPGLLQDQLSFGIHCEDPTCRDANLLVSKHILVVQGDISESVTPTLFTKIRTKSHIYTVSVSKRCVEGTRSRRKKVLDVCQTLHLEFLWLLFNDLSEEIIALQLNLFERKHILRISCSQQNFACEIRVNKSIYRKEQNMLLLTRLKAERFKCLDHLEKALV